MSLFFLRGTLRKILGVARETLENARKTRSTVQVILKEIYAMSQSQDNLNAAVDAAVTRLEELTTEVTDLKAQVAAYAVLDGQAAALEAAAAADAAAEQGAAQKLNEAVAANPV